MSPAQLLAEEFPSENLPITVPASWQVVPIGDAVRVSRESLNPQDYQTEEFEYYSIPAYQNGAVPRMERGIEILSQKLLVQPGAVLFGKLNPRVPKVWLVPSGGLRRKIASTEFIPLTPLTEVADSLFIYHLCWSEFVLPRAEELVSGSTPSRQRTNARSFLDIRVPLPPLPEQRAIAVALETVRQARESCARVIVATRQFKRSLMNHLFAHGLTPYDAADSIEVTESAIGLVPARWEVREVRSLVHRGDSIDPTGTPSWRFRYADVSSVSSETMRIEETIELLGQEAPSRARKLLRFNDVIFATIRPSLRRIALVPKELDGQVCSTAFCVLRPRVDRLVPGFLFYAMCAERFVEQVTQHESGTSYPAVSESAVLDEMIPVPPLAEQQQIADALACVDEKLIREERKRLALDMLWKSLLSSLLTARVRLLEQEESQS